MLEVFLEVGEFEGVAHADDAFEAAVAVGGVVVADGALNFSDEVGKDRPHRLEDLLLVFAGGGGFFEGFGAVEGLFEGLGEGVREVVAADVDGAEPEPALVHDDKVGVFGPHVDEDGALAVVHAVEGGGVVDGERGHLDAVDGQSDGAEVGEDLCDELFFHREDADFDIGGFGGLEGVVVPVDLVQREGDLLDGFKLDDLGNFFGFDRGELDEAGEGGGAGDADEDLFASDGVCARGTCGGCGGSFRRG